MVSELEFVSVTVLSWVDYVPLSHWTRSSLTATQRLLWLTLCPAPRVTDVPKYVWRQWMYV